MSDIEFHANPLIDMDVRKMPVIETKCLKVAEEIAEVARQSAPVGETGEYKAGIVAQTYKGGARVFADDFKSAWIEFGVPSRGIPGHFILRNAAAALGYKFKKRGS